MWTLLTFPSPTRLLSWSCLWKRVCALQVPKDTLCRRIWEGLAVSAATAYKPLIPNHPLGTGIKATEGTATHLPSRRVTCAMKGKHKLAPCWEHPKLKVYMLSALNSSQYWNSALFLPWAPTASLRREPPRDGDFCAVSVMWAEELQTQHTEMSTNRSSYSPVSWYLFD